MENNELDDLYLTDLKHWYNRLDECREQVEVTRQAIKEQHESSDRLANVIGSLDTILDRLERLVSLYGPEDVSTTDTRTIRDVYTQKKKASFVRRLITGE